MKANLNHIKNAVLLFSAAALLSIGLLSAPLAFGEEEWNDDQPSAQVAPAIQEDPVADTAAVPPVPEKPVVNSTVNSTVAPSIQENHVVTAAAPSLNVPPDLGLLASHSPFVRSDPRSVAPFPLLLNAAVQDYVKGFLEQPGGLKLAFARSRPFLPEMVQVMKDKGIPADLVYLSFAESGFSSRGKGPWQFSADTAERFGLRVNRWLDERRDPILSTRAAAEYLAELHDQADNDWRMALIAWNTGEGNLQRYWSLQGSNYTRFANRLPVRTRRLLNRFMAVAFIAQNSAAYGIGPASYSVEPTYETHNFKGGTLLRVIAKRYGTAVAKLRSLNPALETDRIPPSERFYAIRVPLQNDTSS